MRGLCGQERDDVCECFLDAVRCGHCRGPDLDICLAAVAHESLRHLGHRQYEIDTPARDRAAGHAIERGFLGVLHDDEATPLFHRLQAETAVCAGAGEDRADRALTALLRQGAQEEIEGHARAVTLQGLGQPEKAVPDCQGGARWNEIHMVAFGPHPIRHLQNSHRGVTGQQIDHHALVIWIEMLDQHEGHAAVGWQRLEELF